MRRWLVPSATELEKHYRAFNALMTIYEDIAKALATVPEEYQEEIRRRWEESRATRVSPAILSADEQPDWWSGIDKAGLANWTHLMDVLVQKGWHESAIKNLDVESDAVMRELADPRASSGGKAFRIQGLVVGFVQSGKTANFTSVIAKAVDAGYRLVIVLAGIHNSLRRQTQQRLEKELCSGSGRAGPGWLTLTRSDLGGDFQKGTVSGQLLQGNQPMLAVVKKNGARLKMFLDWLPERASVADLPVLVIDDEADQASVNTGGNQSEETDPEETYSRINGRIRELLGRFSKISYVAYTATPFANVFIDHEGFDYRVQQDLYPKDFIIALDKPGTYVGAADLFGFPARGEVPSRAALDVIITVPEADLNYVVPPSRARRGGSATGVPADGDTAPTDFPPALPDSLERAIEDFLIAAGAFLHRRRDRGDQPIGMLIHTTVKTEAQLRIGRLVEEHVALLRRQILYDKETYIPILAKRWAEHFLPTIRSFNPAHVAPFQEIVPFIGRLFESGPSRSPLRVLTVNSATEDVLDYEREPFLKAIVVGGNKLSRGLTIEGLLSSYFVRETPNFDTLLQMGRWFGHRADYVDLTRLHTTEELVDWFQFLGQAEEELREEIRLYGVTGRKPSDFAPRVRRHDFLRPTAANKMRNASTVGTSFAGRLKQTIVFALDRPDQLASNLVAAQRLIDACGTPDDRLMWKEVPADAVVRFLREYRTATERNRAGNVDADQLADYIEAQLRQGELFRWSIRVVCKGEAGGPTDGRPELSSLPPITRSRIKGSNSIGILVNPVNREMTRGDELLGLTDAQLEQARGLMKDDRGGWGGALRYVRDPGEGALLLYMIDPESQPDDDERQTRTRREPLYVGGVPPSVPKVIVGFAIVFPESKSAATDDEHWIGPAGAYERS